MTKQLLITRDRALDAADDAIWIESFGCALEATYLDPARNACLFVLPGIGCVDQTGAVNLAVSLLPEVNLIATCNEVGWDTAYMKLPSGGWSFIDMRGTDDVPWDSTSALMGSADRLVPMNKIIETLLKTGSYVLSDDFDAVAMNPEADSMATHAG